MSAPISGGPASSRRPARCNGWCSANTTAAIRRVPRRSTQACKRGGINAELSDDVRRSIWEKYVVLVAMSGATTAMRSTIGPIRANPLTREFLLDLAREVVAVGRAHGVQLPADYAEQRIPFFDGWPPEMTTSMHHDLQARQTARGPLALRRRGRSWRRRSACPRR